MNRRLSAFLLAPLLAFAALAGCARAEPLVSVSVLDLDRGETMPRWPHRGRDYVEGRPGHRYAVVLQNLTGQRVLAVAISRAASGYAARLSLPHGLGLPEGVQVWIDDGPRTKHAIATADQNGSYAVVPLDEAMIAAMKKGTILNVLVKAASGDEVTFQLSLNGFTAALARI